MTDPEIPAPDPSRQIAFHQLLVAARKQWLGDALDEALAAVDPNRLKIELMAHVPVAVQQLLQAARVRDELVFPTPVVLEARPTLVGYYRLLLGLPQKTFYGTGTGMSRFRSMEERGALDERQRLALPAFCTAMGAALADLVRQMSPPITSRDTAELPLLALGSQFQGANNNTIGQRATLSVFLAIEAIMKDHVVERDARRLTIENAAGRTVVVTLAADPDVRIEEEFGGTLRRKVAIEIKGGTDRSNAFNRAGEAEKSHQTAKDQGFRDFWTVIAKRGLDPRKLAVGSPTTNSWFDAAQVIGQAGEDWDEFRGRVADAVGIPL